MEHEQQKDFHACLNALGFNFYEESDNPAYCLFSGGRSV
jgi:hypothetical protein